jgi:methionyl-tRNA synthetase
MPNKQKFYVTTPIYYVTAAPHLGSLYSTLIADVLARWQQLLGKRTFFMTGTDEHGQKIAQAAEKAGKAPKVFIDSFIPVFQDTWKKYNIQYNYFGRTTNPEHVKGAQHLMKMLIKKGDVYKGKYEGWYCTPDETFVVEKTAETPTAPLCPSCGRSTILVSEETYFFKLSAYQDKLLKFYQDNPNFIIPRERAHEVISFMQSGLKDLSISRTTVKWGIPFPDDPEHIIYVWAEALCIYITSVGYPDKKKEFDLWWPADVQVMGKDIIRFHAVFWPAFLMAAGLPLPKQLLVHGWIKVNQQKMSKSFGNVVDPIQLYNTYGADPVRYYLMRQLAINQDGEFSTGDLEQKIASDLANDLGNLLQRMTSLAEKYTVVKVTPPAQWSEKSLALREEGWNTVQDVQTLLEDFEFHNALNRIWKFIHQTNAYFHEHEPWKLAKDNPVLFMEVLSATCHSLRMIAIVLWPVMPSKMEELLISIGKKLDSANNTIEKLELGRWHQTFVLKKIPPLFTKPDISISGNQKKELQKMNENSNEITIDDFTKVELLVGTIEQVDEVPNSDKLYKLQVDFGPRGKRQILSGIRTYFQKTELAQQQAVFVFNLKSRSMMGLESQGMLLVVQDEQGNRQLVVPGAQVPNGSKLH